LDRWLAYYEAQSAVHLERSALLYARPAGRDAAALLAAVETRVRQAVRQWKTTGGGAGGAACVPDEGPLRAGANTPARPQPQAKALHPEGGVAPDSAAALRAQLGPGQGLPGGVRGRMEQAFGQNFDTVRIHTDTHAADLARRHASRAFTLGQD